MLKINQKKKRPYTANIKGKPKTEEKPAVVRPEWNDSQSDSSKYKLSQAELIQKKISLISKHKYEARDLWQKRQEKLQKGIIDEETATIFETCLSSKRPPEKNHKNMTYFIRNDQSQSRGSRMDDCSPEISENLSMSDLNFDSVKLKSEKSVSVAAPAKDKDLMNKIEENLKDTRDLIQKMDRYSSVKKAQDPEKTLNFLKTFEKEKQTTKSTASLSKEAKPKMSYSTAESHSENVKKVTFGKTDLNNKENNFFSGNGFEDEITKKIPFEVNDDNDDDIAKYFTSLNKIEDTIKFLEENIISDTQPSTNVEEAVSEKLVEKNEDFVSLPPKPKQTFKEDFSDSFLKDSPKELKKTENKIEKFMNNDYMNRISEPMDDDEQISFSLTIRSGDPFHLDENGQSEFFSSFEKGKKQIEDTKQSKKDIFDDIDEKPELLKVASQPKPTMANYSENRDYNEKLSHKFITTKSIPQLQQQREPEEDDDEEEEGQDDEDDLNIDKIKQLLQATRADIERMNSTTPSNVKLPSSVQSYKTQTYQEPTPVSQIFKPLIPSNYSPMMPSVSITTPVSIKENVPNNQTKSFNIEKNEKVKSSEVEINVKQPMQTMLDNQRKILEEITNFNPGKPLGFDQEKKSTKPLSATSKANFSPRYNDDNSLSIRSFMRK